MNVQCIEMNVINASVGCKVFDCRANLVKKINALQVKDRSEEQNI
jgi:hypothetical protein